MLAGWFALWLAFTGGTPAHAASGLELRHAPDGTWHVIGTGWRPGDQVEVSLGVARFPAYVDDAGDFEVATGLTTTADVAVHRPVAREPAMLSLNSEPNPLTVALVQGLTEGAALTALSSGLLLLLVVGVRRWRQASPP